MRAPITLQEFLFALNQDEDMLVTLINYERDEKLYSGWKLDFDKHEYDKWFVQDFITTLGGLEITIVKFKEELD